MTSVGWIALFGVLAAGCGGGEEPQGARPGVVRVETMDALRSAIREARPGTEIVIAAGRYGDSLYAENVRGAKGLPIILRGESRKNPPQFVGWQLSRVSHLQIQDIELRGARSNGLNIDDGGGGQPSRHIRIERVRVSDLPAGNHDGIKLSGVEDFEVIDSRVERWGGSAVDMVGCHRGVIRGCVFREGGDNGVQAKGGSSEIAILDSRFERPGQRGVNLGGSTGREFFRPANATWEAKALRVENCTFVGGVAAIAFVGVDGATVRRCTIYRPERWAIRILQETTDSGFTQCRNGLFERNTIVFHSSWASGGVNVGPGTLPLTFRFEANRWYCLDRPQQSTPRLPTREKDGVYGVDPGIGEP